MITRRVLVAALLLPAAAASAATRVSSDSSCPSSDAISSRLLDLLPTGGPENASARTYTDQQSMRIEVATPGEVTRQRTVPLAGDCDERAEMAALVIASWLGAMPAGTIGAPELPAKVQQAGGAQSETADAGRAGEPIRGSGRTLVGASMLGMADEQGVSPGIALGAVAPELIESFGLALEMSVGLSRDISVGAGTASYWRPTFALRATADLYRRRWVLRAMAGPALGVLTVSGSGYDRNGSETTVMWGADLGLVLARAWGQREAWIALGAMIWPQGRSIRSKPDGPGSQVGLPEWEARFGVGLSWEIRGSGK